MALALVLFILKHSSESAMHSLSTTFYLEQEGNAAKHVDPAFIPMTKWAGRRPFTRPKGLQYICTLHYFITFHIHVVLTYKTLRLYDSESA